MDRHRRMEPYFHQDTSIHHQPIFLRGYILKLLLLGIFHEHISALQDIDHYYSNQAQTPSSDTDHLHTSTVQGYHHTGRHIQQRYIHHLSLLEHSHQQHFLYTPNHSLRCKYDN